MDSYHPFVSREDHACYMVAHHLSQAAQYFENTFEDLDTLKSTVAFYGTQHDISGFSAPAITAFLEKLHEQYQDD